MEQGEEDEALVQVPVVNGIGTMRYTSLAVAERIPTHVSC